MKRRERQQKPGRNRGNRKCPGASGDTASDSSGEGDTDDTGAVMTADPSEIDLDEDDYYVVQKGDTLDTISMKVYGDAAHVDAICRMNGLSDGNLIYIGQKLLLP